MAIIHEKITLATPDPPVIFASLLGISCSVCAPDSMTAVEIEAFANREGPMPSAGRWIVVDKGQPGFGTHAPNPCNQVAGRQHWFLLNELNAIRAGATLKVKPQ